MLSLVQIVLYGWHLNIDRAIEGARGKEMRRGSTVAFVLAGCLLLAPWLSPQAPASGAAAGAGQNKPADSVQKSPRTQPQSSPQSSSNPFPTDTKDVPVLHPDAAPADDSQNNKPVSLPGDDLDPARGPDDAVPSAPSDQQKGYSSSASGLDTLLPKPDDDQPEKGRKKRGPAAEPEHQETASEDITVGKYYLDQKAWKAAQSRFQSALVLDPEEPDVYWGLAESDRHLGDFANARTYYQKVVDYDPDSRHGKDARKALKDPQIANAQKSSLAQQPSITQK
jgi:hypothetical protein